MTSIVLTICQKHRIKPEMFFSKERSRRLAACRRDAIIALRQAGFSMRGCARMIKRDCSTVYYWLHPEVRERKLVAMRKRKSWKKQQERDLEAAPRVMALEAA